MAVKKIDVKKERWDKIFAPSSCLVVITTVDQEVVPKRRPRCH